MQSGFVGPETLRRQLPEQAGVAWATNQATSAAAQHADEDGDDALHASGRRLRTVFISDIHLGTAGCQAKALLTFLKAHPSERLYLVGDIIDGWQLRRKWYWPQSHNDVVQKILRRARKGCKVIFVPGNHEYDGLEYDEVGPRMREVCERLGLIWLDREVVLIDDVRFVGTTLWSDFESLAQREASPVRHDEMLKKSLRAANFYLSKNSTLRGGQHLLAEDIQPMGRDCQRWLRETLIKPHDGPTVVVTHFAPTLHSNDPRYGLNPGTAGFCNHLDDLLFHVDLWVHGHLHCPQDRRLGRCRVVANPLGYADKNEQGAFQALTCIDLSAPDPA